MSVLDDIKAAAAEVGASAEAARDRVTATIADLRAQLADAQAQIQELIDAGGPSTAELQEVLESINLADSLVDSIEPAPAEEEPAPEEEPPTPTQLPA